MPKKGTRHLRESGIARRCQPAVEGTAKPELRTKRFRSVHIGVRNGRRWLSLKKRLGLSTDEDLAVYLLDLADSVARRDGKCNEAKTWKAERDKENIVESHKAESSSLEAEEPLRRSPRKQGPAVTPDTETTQTNSPDSQQQQLETDETSPHDRRSSRTKRHKSKAKHHKEKRKRRKHPKTKDTVTDDEIEEPSSTISPIQSEEKDSARCDERNVSENGTDDFGEEKFVVQTEQIDSSGSKEVLDRIVFLENVSSKNKETKDNSLSANRENVKDIPHSVKGESAQNSINNNPLESYNQDTSTKDIADLNEEETNVNVPSKTDFENDSTKSITSHNKTQGINSIEDNTENDDSEDRKTKKKRKRTKLEGENENKPANESNESLDETHKHRRRKHKHLSEHKVKKHHDVRKAPQDGIVIAEKELETPVKEPTPIPAEVLVEQILESAMTEPQRLAIKIKLCQDCNSRHLQDACPLTIPQYTIKDSVTYDEWINAHSNNSEVTKTINEEDPMSEGYGKVQDDGFESDEESVPTEQYKTKIKAESEEKQLLVDANRPLFARDSLPEGFELKITNSEHGLGVFTKSLIPTYAQLGPLVGCPVKEMDIPDDFTMRHIWEVDNNSKTTYISTTNPLKSNWVRYIRPAETKEDRNVAVIAKEGELHLITTQSLSPGTELIYWADSQSSAWTRKNKIDKTNCGGCNLNFSHPIYYRLHCCIFHDTNYSLTIRKYHCKVCGAAVLGKDNIMKHAAELHAGRGAYQCQYCKKFFLRLNYLEMHRTYGCSQNPQRSRPLCDFCGRKFCQPQKLKVHIKRMHSDMSEVLREFQCKLCLKLLGSRAALQRHMKEVHHKDVVGAATCDRCGKMFQNKSNLKIHMLTHSGVKPFKCRENGCKAAFTTKQCLQFHYKKVHGLSEDMMPRIERSVAYTFDAYSGGLVEDTGRGKTPKFSRNDPQPENSNSLPSLDDCSSENSMKTEMAVNSVQQPPVIEFQGSNSSLKLKPDRDVHTPIPPPPTVTITNAPVIEPTVDNVRTEVDLYATSRLPSKGSKKWMGEFNPPVPHEIPTAQLSAPTNDIYEFEEPRRDDEEKDSLITSQSMIDETKLGMSLYRRTESSNASLLVEAALDAAERDIGTVSSPIMEDGDRETTLYSITNHLHSPIPQRSPEQHLESYIQHQEELMSPAPAPDNRHTPPNHMHVDYHLHRPIEYMSTGTRTHNIEQYLHHEDVPRVASPAGYIHVSQDDLASPSATPNTRYPVVHHHQVTDNLSSDEGDSVAQNLSLSVKEKALQLDLSTSYKYDSLEAEFGRERSNFEPLVLNGGELQGLDMSARGFHHSFGTQVQNTRYHHHHHHLYEITERQSVDLSRTGGYSMSPPPPPPPPYPHSDVLRVVSLDLTPGGRHSIDLSLSRSHHLHGTGARLLTSPQPPGSTTPHMITDAVEGRMLSPPPPPMPGYNATYPVGPAPYHPPRTGYHHYSGYY